MTNRIRVAVNGYGVIGRRVADAVRLQPDMELVGVADVAADYRIRTAALDHIPVYASDEDRAAAMRDAGIPVEGSLDRLLGAADGLVAFNSAVELMKELHRPRGDMWEVAVWEDVLSVQSDEAFLTYQVDNQAIVVPETIDAIRALIGRVRDGAESIRMTDAALGLRQEFVSAQSGQR